MPISDTEVICPEVYRLVVMPDTCHGQKHIIWEWCWGDRRDFHRQETVKHADRSDINLQRTRERERERAQIHISVCVWLWWSVYDLSQSVSLYSFVYDERETRRVSLCCLIRYSIQRLDLAPTRMMNWIQRHDYRLYLCILYISMSEGEVQFGILYRMSHESNAHDTKWC